MVAAVGERQAQQVRAFGLAGGGAHRAGVVVQHHACQQGRHLRFVDGVARGGQIDLGHVAPRMRQAVDQRALVGEQQQARGVMVEPAHRLHAAPAQRRRQQVEHPGMVARLA